MLNMDVKSVVVVGAGFVVCVDTFETILITDATQGGPTATVLASHAEDIDVTVIDTNQARIDAWNSAELPISEPGLLDLVLAHRVNEHDRKPVTSRQQSIETLENTDRDATCRRRNLCFSANVDGFLRNADMIFLCVDTPQRADSEMHESAPDLTNLKKAIRRIGEIAEKDFVVVEKATVPCGTAKVVEGILHETLRPGVRFEVLSNPEFLAEGNAVRDLEDPDRILIGSADSVEGHHAATLLAQLYEYWVPSQRIITSDTWSSELAKLSSNALLSQRISSINSIGMICEQTGADVREVSKAVKSDPRIGSQMLSASIGFGGSCFQKDVAHLVYLANSLGLPVVAQYWKAVLQLNQLQKDTFADRISRQLETYHPGTPLHIAVLGFAFKAETNDARNSPAIDIVKSLIAKHHVRIYDPCVPKAAIFTCLGLDQAGELTQGPGSVTVCPSAYEACQAASAVAVLTEWNEFAFSGTGPTTCLQNQAESDSSSSSSRSTYSSDSGLGRSPDRACRLKSTSSLDWERVAQTMQAPKFLFDGRNIIDDSIRKYGFKVERIGKKSDSVEDATK